MFNDINITKQKLKFEIYFWDCFIKKFIVQYRYAYSYAQANKIILEEAAQMGHQIIIQETNIVADTQWYIQER